MDELEQGTAPDTDLSKEFSFQNIAEDLDEDTLNKISSQVKEGFELDMSSRKPWERDLDDWTKLAMQVREAKSFPWQNASNVKYPMLSTAAMQFAARAYPSLVPSNGKVVVGKVFGKDATGEKRKRADRIASYMSYQVMEELADWEEDMDRLLMMLPIVGMLFKKTYYCADTEKVCSYLLSPKNLVVNYWAKSIEDAERVSEIIEMSQRVLKEKQLAGEFLDVDLGAPPKPAEDRNSAVIDETTPYTIIEQHTFFDKDKDGYAEPYIVTFHRESGKILRIIPRFYENDVKVNADGKITRIKPTEYYTKFSFIPNPDGSFYSIGFGVLLGPLNESVNTLINQLVDAGTLSNLQSGFIGKGIKIKVGDSSFRPGEWKPVNSTGDDLKKQIVPLPAKDPSETLFKLMGTLITSGKELASVAEIFTGKMPGQNTPATTTMATVEQGMKVFTAVYKRIFRSLDSEFKKIYFLNARYLDPETYVGVLDEPVGPQDFNSEDYDVCPGADPNAVSQQEKLMKAQGLLELLPTGILNPVEVVKRVLEAQEQSNIEQILNPEVAATGQPPPPQPDPKQIEMQMKSELEQKKFALKSQADQQKMELEGRTAEQKMAMQAQQHQMDIEQKAQLNQVEAATALHKQRIFQVEGQQKLQQNAESHQQNLQMKKEQSSVQQKNSNSGKPKK